MRLYSFDHFRAVAILFVVAGHSYWPWVIDNFGEKVLSNILTGGTHLFVFISGFFFHHVYYAKFDYRRFLLVKSKTVLSPYLLISILAIAVLAYIDRLDPVTPVVTFVHWGWLDRVVWFADYLWTGRISYAYWYIPFIALIFILSPLFVRYTRLSLTARLMIFGLLMVVSLFVHRPIDNVSPWRSVLYFLPVYLLGINCSIDRVRLVEYLRGKELALGSVVVALAVLQAVLYDGIRNFHKLVLWSYNGIDLMLLQKLFLCFFFMALLSRFESKKIPGFELLASSSFAIYFLHTWVLDWIGKLGFYPAVAFLPGFTVFLMTVTLAVLGSLLVAYPIKLALKKNSRYLIGW